MILIWIAALAGLVLMLWACGVAAKKADEQSKKMLKEWRDRNDKG